MNVFEFCQNLSNEYAELAGIKADDVRIFVNGEYVSQKYWQDLPPVQVNPNFQLGGTGADLCQSGQVSQSCPQISRFAKLLFQSGKYCPCASTRWMSSLASVGESYALTMGAA